MVGRVRHGASPRGRPGAGDDPVRGIGIRPPDARHGSRRGPGAARDGASAPARAGGPPGAESPPIAAEPHRSCARVGRGRRGSVPVQPAPDRPLDVRVVRGEGGAARDSRGARGRPGRSGAGDRYRQPAALSPSVAGRVAAGQRSPAPAGTRRVPASVPGGAPDAPALDGRRLDAMRRRGPGAVRRAGVPRAALRGPDRGRVPGCGLRRSVHAAPAPGPGESPGRGARRGRQPVRLGSLGGAAALRSRGEERDRDADPHRPLARSARARRGKHRDQRHRRHRLRHQSADPRPHGARFARGDAVPAPRRPARRVKPRVERRERGRAPGVPQGPEARLRRALSFLVPQPRIPPEPRRGGVPRRSPGQPDLRGSDDDRVSARVAGHGRASCRSTARRWAPPRRAGEPP